MAAKLNALILDSTSTPGKPLTNAERKEEAALAGNLSQLGMNDEEMITGIQGDEHVFYTDGLHGCLVYLYVTRTGIATFGHVDVGAVINNLDRFINMAAKLNAIILKPAITELPELERIVGPNVTTYRYEIYNYDYDAHKAAWDESPGLHSVCISLKRTVSGYEVRLSAFERAPGAQLVIPYLPEQADATFIL